MMIDRILDVTLRDGAMGLGFPFDERQVCDYLRVLGQVGINHAEIGYVGGPAGYEGNAVSMANVNVEPETLSVVRSFNAITQLYRMIDAGNQRVRLDEVTRTPTNAGVIRVAVDHIREVSNAVLPRELATSGIPFSVNLKHSGSKTTQEILDVAKASWDCGARIFYIVDTSGTMQPKVLRRKVEAVKAAIPEIQIGFHGHDNLGLSVANALIALESGVDLVDASLGGVGAGGGNTPLETLLLILSDGDLGPFEKLTKAYGALADQIKPTLGEKAFWGFIGANSRVRSQIIRSESLEQISRFQAAAEWFREHRANRDM